MTRKVINLNNYLFSKFGEKVWKIPLSFNNSCPNRNNDKTGGCVYCDLRGSRAPWVKSWMNVYEQFIKGRGIVKRFYNVSKYIAYFQSYTSTCFDEKTQIDTYENIRKISGVLGLAISTRPDSISQNLIDYFDYLNKKTFLWIEIGAQSMFDDSLKWINRGCRVSDFINIYKKLNSLNIQVVPHVIFGLPCEDKNKIIGSFKKLIDLGVDAYKIHPLCVVKGTKLEQIYLKEKFRILTINEYFDLLDTAFKISIKDTVVHRISFDVLESLLIEPRWALDKNKINSFLNNYLIKK